MLALTLAVVHAYIVVSCTVLPRPAPPVVTASVETVNGVAHVLVRTVTY
jgi:hypothetical protein